MSNQESQEGGCRCDRVRFTVTEKPLITMACHCTGCQKMSSSAWMFSRPNGVEDLINLRPTMLDDASGYVPFIETWTSEKLPWATTPAQHSFAQLPERENFPALIQAYAEYSG
eukprot:gene21607-25645_t